MTLEIALVLGILVVALILFVTEWLRMDLVALLVLSSLALLGPPLALLVFALAMLLPPVVWPL